MKPSLIEQESSENNELRRDPSGGEKEKKCMSFVDDRKQNESAVPSPSRRAYIPQASAYVWGVTTLREQRLWGVTTLREHLVGGKEGHDDEGQVTEVGNQAADHALVRVAAAVP